MPVDRRKAAEALLQMAKSHRRLLIWTIAMALLGLVGTGFWLGCMAVRFRWLDAAGALLSCAMLALFAHVIRREVRTWERTALLLKEARVYLDDEMGG